MPGQHCFFRQHKGPFQAQPPSLSTARICPCPQLLTAGPLLASLFSLYRSSLVLDPRVDNEIQYFDTAAKFIRKIIDAGIHEHIPPWHLLNINVPNLSWEDIAGIQSTFVGVQKYSDEILERSDIRGRPYYWLGGQYLGSEDIPGSDCNAVADGFISLDLQDQHGKNISHPEFEEIVKNIK